MLMIADCPVVWCGKTIAQPALTLHLELTHHWSKKRIEKWEKASALALPSPTSR